VLRVALLIALVCSACRADLCTQYCTALDKQCASQPQFVDASACDAFCRHAGVPLGSESDTAVNTIGCRLHYANASQCDIAGSSGGGVCGEWCDAYCAMTQASCTGNSQLYSSADDCHQACTQQIETLPPSADGKPGGTGGMANAGEGNTVQCRIFQVSQAAGDATHAPESCAAASLSSRVCKAGR
jgi:hypothetical protein